MAWAELGRTAAVGLLSVGIHGAQVAPPIFTDASSAGEKPGVLAQDYTHRSIDFSQWPSGGGVGDCFNAYPDLEAREFQFFVRCPSRIARAIVPGNFLDFTVDITAKKISGSNVWYGPTIYTDRVTRRESEYQFLVTDEGMFRYQKEIYDDNFNKVRAARIQHPLPVGSEQTEGARSFRVVRRGGRIEVSSNGTLLFEDEILLNNRIANIAFTVSTPLGLGEEAHVSLQSINIHFPRERRPSDLAMLPFFNLPNWGGKNLNGGV